MRKEIKIVIFLLLIILAIGVGYFIGYKSAYDRIENATPNITPETFYAEIKEMKENWFQVEGLSINDINYRGKFEFSVDGETELEWRGTAIEVSDFDIGDTISITYFGGKNESNYHWMPRSGKEYFCTKIARKNQSSVILFRYVMA